jgi:nucleoside-diphosphate-sugar epimerase
LFTVYGTGEHAGRLLPSLLAKARLGGTLPLTQGDQHRDFTYVADVADGLLRLGALPRPSFGVVNLATGVLASVRTFAECAAELLGLKREQLQFGVLPYAQEDMQQGPADMDLLRQLVGWVPPCSIQEGIRQTIEFEARLSRVGK